MGWNWPIASWLFGGTKDAIDDWWKKYGWVVYCVVVLIVVIMIAWIYKSFRGH